jgi:hypothetical protein
LLGIFVRYTLAVQLYASEKLPLWQKMNIIPNTERTKWRRLAAVRHDVHCAGWPLSTVFTAFIFTDRRRKKCSTATKARQFRHHQG